MIETMLMKPMIILSILSQHYIMNVAPIGMYSQENPLVNHG